MSEKKPENPLKGVTNFVSLGDEIIGELRPKRTRRRKHVQFNPRYFNKQMRRIQRSTRWHYA